MKLLQRITGQPQTRPDNQLQVSNRSQTRVLSPRDAAVVGHANKLSTLPIFMPFAASEILNRSALVSNQLTKFATFLPDGPADLLHQYNQGLLETVIEGQYPGNLLTDSDVGDGQNDRRHFREHLEVSPERRMQFALRPASEIVTWDGMSAQDLVVVPQQIEFTNIETGRIIKPISPIVSITDNADNTTLRQYWLEATRRFTDVLAGLGLDQVFIGVYNQYHTMSYGATMPWYEWLPILSGSHGNRAITSTGRDIPDNEFTEIVKYPWQSQNLLVGQREASPDEIDYIRIYHPKVWLDPKVITYNETLKLAGKVVRERFIERMYPLRRALILTTAEMMTQQGLRFPNPDVVFGPATWLDKAFQRYEDVFNKRMQDALLQRNDSSW